MRISISQQVLVSILALLALQVLSLVATGVAVQGYRSNTELLASTVLPAAQALSDLRAAGAEISNESLHYAVHGEPEHLAQRNEAISTARALLSKLEEFQQDDISQSAAAQNDLDTLQAAFTDLMALSDQIVQQRQPDLLVSAASQLDVGHTMVDQATERFAQSFDDERQLAVDTARTDPLLLPRILGGLVVLVVLGQLVVARRTVIRPLLALRSAALAVAAGDRQQQVRADSRDEIGDLGRAFNMMIARVGAQEQALQERAATLEQANTAQRQLLDTVRALDVPAIPVGEGVLALPLVGTVDAARADQLTQRLLGAVHRERASTVLLDVTGLATVDDNAARYLLDTAQQLRLLGARTIITGIRADLAHTLAALDLDLDAIDVRATLREGIAEALEAQSAER